METIVHFPENMLRLLTVTAATINSTIARNGANRRDCEDENAVGDGILQQCFKQSGMTDNVTLEPIKSIMKP